jgi:quinol monooxygenase YgiN
MAALIVHHKVQDYPAWRKGFDETTLTRTRFGSTGQQVYRSPSDPNEITILTVWKDISQARTYAQSNELKEAMKNAGVISQPDVTFLDEVKNPEVDSMGAAEVNSSRLPSVV